MVALDEGLPLRRITSHVEGGQENFYCFTVLQLHLDHTIGAYFDYGNHTEKVSAALSELSFRSPLSISIVTTIM
jgi:hypothetical protein